MRRSMSTTLFALTVLAANAAAQLTQIKVPQDFPTIQAGLDHIVSNQQQELVIAGGTYAEAVTCTGKNFFNITCKGKVVIAPPSGTGFTLTSCDHIFIQNLRVKGGDIGIQLTDCTQLVFFLGGVEATTGDGIRIEGDTATTLELLTIKDAGQDGVSLAVGSKDTDVATGLFDCKIIGAARDGVGVNGDSNAVNGCKILQAGRDGVSLDDAGLSTSTFIKDTKIIKPVRHGVLIRGDGTHVDGCKITAPGGDGLDFESGTGGFVTDSKFSKTGDHGAELGGDGITLDTNVFAKPGLDGVSVSGDAIVVQTCKVTGAAGSGFDIVGTNGTYTGNTVSKAKQDGFFLAGTGNTLSTNTAKGSKGFDLDNPLPLNNTVDSDNNFKKQGP